MNTPTAAQTSATLIGFWLGQCLQNTEREVGSSTDDQKAFLTGNYPNHVFLATGQLYTLRSIWESDLQGYEVKTWPKLFEAIQKAMQSKGYDKELRKMKLALELNTHAFAAPYIQFVAL